MMNVAWIWVICGLLLMAAEFLIPGLWIIFFGVSSLITAGLIALFPGFTFPYALIFCSVMGIVLLILSRRCFPAFFSSQNNTDTSEKYIEEDDVTGALATVTVDISVHRPGKVDFRGSLWTAESDTDIPAGKTVEVVYRRNLSLFVKEP